MAIKNRKHFFKFPPSVLSSQQGPHEGINFLSHVVFFFRLASHFNSAN